MRGGPSLCLTRTEVDALRNGSRFKPGMTKLRGLWPLAKGPQGRTCSPSFAHAHAFPRFAEAGACPGEIALGGAPGGDGMGMASGAPPDCHAIPDLARSGAFRERECWSDTSRSCFPGYACARAFGIVNPDHAVPGVPSPG